jgi:shikimate dehydrogenase
MPEAHPTAGISAHTKLCAVLGFPVRHSMSPVLHNAAYQHCGLSDQFAFLAFEVQPAGLSAAVAGLRELGAAGFAVTLPHKRAILPLLDEVSPLALRIGAVNTVRIQNGKLLGENTDIHGVLEPLRKRLGAGTLRGCRVALLGAGGAARAALVGLLNEGASVTILNRSQPNAKALADEFSVAYSSLDDLQVLRDAQVVINSTSVGMRPQVEVSPIALAGVNSQQLVFDLVYTPLETKLLRDARAAGARTIPGLEMFLEQAARQFELFTGHTAPHEHMRTCLLQALGA